MAAESFSSVDELHMVRAALCDHRMSRSDVAVYAAILSHCNGKLRACPGKKRLSEVTDVALSNVKAAVKRLEERRYLIVERSGTTKANWYQVLPTPRVPPRELASRKGCRKASRKASDEGSARDAGDPSSRDAGRPSASRVARDAGIPSTRDAGRPDLGMRAGPELAFNSPKNSLSAPRVLTDTERQEQQRQQREERTASLRAEYLATKDTHPAHARMMERTFAKELADLIEDRAA